MPDKETSSEISSLAGFYLGLSLEDWLKLIKESDDEGLVEIYNEIKSISASCLSQDTTPEKD